MKPLNPSLRVVGVLAEIRTGHFPNRSNKFYHVNPFLLCEKLPITASRMEMYNISGLQERKTYRASCDLFVFKLNIQCTYKDNASLVFYFMKKILIRYLLSVCQQQHFLL
jgi:hypothetical protein